MLESWFDESNFQRIAVLTGLGNSGSVFCVLVLADSSAGKRVKVNDTQLIHLFGAFGGGDRVVSCAGGFAAQRRLE